MGQPLLFPEESFRASEPKPVLAEFSSCRRWRYLLRRYWGGTGPPATFVCLNPSTADEIRDDPTIRRCSGFAQSWGCSSMGVVNLFAWRSTDPRALRKAEDPIGPDNNRFIYQEARKAAVCGGPVVIAWGNHGHYLGRGGDVIELLSEFDLKAFRRTNRGQPWHPLMLRKDSRLYPWPM